MLSNCPLNPPATALKAVSPKLVSQEAPPPCVAAVLSPAPHAPPTNPIKKQRRRLGDGTTGFLGASGGIYISEPLQVSHIRFCDGRCGSCCTNCAAGMRQRGGGSVPGRRPADATEQIGCLQRPSNAATKSAVQRGGPGRLQCRHPPVCSRRNR